MKTPPASVVTFNVRDSTVFLGPPSAYGMSDLRSVSVFETYRSSSADSYATGVLDALKTDRYETTKLRDYLAGTDGEYTRQSRRSFDPDQTIRALHEHLRSGRLSMVVVDLRYRHATASSPVSGRSRSGRVPLAPTHQATRAPTISDAAPKPTVQPGHTIPPPPNVAGWSVEQRLKLLFQDMLPLLGEDLRATIASMLTGKALAELVAGFVLLAGLQAIPGVGEIVDTAILGLAYLHAGWDGLRAIPLLVQSIRKAASATSTAEIATAAPDAARALETLGVDMLTILLAHAAKRHTSGGSSTAAADMDEAPPVTVNRERGSGIKSRKTSTVLDPATIERIKAIPKGERPDPSTYMSQNMINAQLAPFKNSGATKFMTSDNLARYGPAQRDGTSFVMSSSEADDLESTAGGDKNALAKALGIDPQQLSGSDLVRVDFRDPSAAGLRIPSGNEAGANDQWIPGGRLPDGNLEAIIDPTDPKSYIIKVIGQ